MVAIKSSPGNDGRYISLLINYVNKDLPPPPPGAYITPKEGNSVPLEMFERAIKERPSDIKRVTFNQITQSINAKDCCHTPGWTLNLIAKLYKSGVSEVLEINEIDLNARKLFWYREKRQEGVSFIDSCKQYTDLSKLLITIDPVKNYAEKCFTFHKFTFNELFTPNKGIEILNNFTNKPIPKEWVENFNNRCLVNKRIINKIDKYKYS